MLNNPFTKLAINGQQIAVYLLLAVALILLGVLVGWNVNGWRLNANFNQERLLAALQLEEARLQNQLTESQWQLNTQRLNKQHSEELANAKKTADGLRNDLRDKRLQFSAHCKLPATTQNSTTSGMDDGETRAELGEEDARAILDSAIAADECAIALTGLQDYVKAIQHKITL